MLLLTEVGSEEKSMLQEHHSFKSISILVFLQKPTRCKSQNGYSSVNATYCTLLISNQLRRVRERRLVMVTETLDGNTLPSGMESITESMACSVSALLVD